MGSIISRAKRESLLFTFFCPPCKKEKAKAKTLPNKNNSVTRIRGVSKSSRIARTDRSRREFERSFLIYCGRQLTESASVTLTDSRARNRVGGERLRDGEHSIRIKKSEREREKRVEYTSPRFCPRLPSVLSGMNRAYIWFPDEHHSCVSLSLENSTVLRNDLPLSWPINLRQRSNILVGDSFNS